MIPARKTNLLPSPKEMYMALLAKDSRYEGVFYAAVKTTGIFCRPSCTARKPKPENVEYFATTKEALDHGYRPCRVCDPMTPRGAVPTWLSALWNEIHKDPGVRWNDARIRASGIDPARVRRWFQKNHGMTFQAYLRARRMNRAFDHLRVSEKVIDSAFESGYESLSGFGAAFKKTIGLSPSRTDAAEVIRMCRISTPLGPMVVGAVSDGICLLQFADRRMIETQVKRLRAAARAQALPGESPYFAVVKRELDEYFAGKRKKFEVPLALIGTPFQKKAWEALLAIPYGQTRSYQEQAGMLGDVKAVRAAARANGDNPIGIIVPCHRVIGKSGKLVGYGGGIWRKKALLELEGVPVNA